MPTRASRRAVLGGTSGAGVAVLASVVAGCGRTDGAGAEGGAAAAGPIGTSAPAVDADSDLVGVVAEGIAGTLALALSTAASLPSVRPLARRLAQLHRFHLGELGQDADVSAGRVGGRPEVARARLLRAEERLQERLVDAALAAESGALAQVFAAMAAAVAQERTLAG